MTRTLIDTPVGPVLLTGDATGLTEIRFLGSEEPPAAVGGSNGAGAAVVAEAARQLRAYFAGERRTFDLPLAPAGTPFQLAVWRALADIPYGRTESYGELARRIGRPNAVRAVGAANGANPLPIVVPCHRVIGADGSLTGYGGGLPIKQALLELEGAMPAAARELPLA
jgi:methylated-DNA-[protein]-cysteine S-methyltransferase